MPKTTPPKFRGFLSDQALESLAAVAAQSTGADDVQRAPVSQLFDDAGYSDDSLFIGSVKHAGERGRLWHLALASWTGHGEFAAPGWGGPPNVAEQVCGYLHILGQGIGLVDRHFYPGAELEIQTRLALLLTSHPVLLHPSLRVHVDSWYGSGTLPLAHAIACTRGAAFPMKRHGLTDTQLKRFALDRCVAAGLRSRAVNGRQGVKESKGKTALAFGMNMIASRPLLLVAYDGYDRVWNESSPTDSRLARRLTGDNHMTLAQACAKAFPEGVGCYITGVDELRFARAPDFIDMVKSSGMVNTPDFNVSMTLVLPRAVIPCAQVGHPNPQAVLPAATYAGTVESCRITLQGLVDIGAAPNLQAAGEYTCKALASFGFPHCEQHQALAVVRVLHEHGVTLDASRLGEKSPGVWFDAMRMHATETGMRAVIEQAELADVKTTTARRCARL